jgi:hypothetical protein
MEPGMYAGQNVHSIPAALSDGEGDAEAQLGKGCGVGFQLVGSHEWFPLVEAGAGFGGGKRQPARGHLSLLLYLEQGAIEVYGIGEFGMLHAALSQSLGGLCVADHDPLSV